MTTIHRGAPGGTPDEAGDEYGQASVVDARFERQVAAALEQWLFQGLKLRACSTICQDWTPRPRRRVGG